MAKRSSKRREWTKIDVRELKTLAREKTPARKIARALKRTEAATRQKAVSLGLSFDLACSNTATPRYNDYIRPASAAFLLFIGLILLDFQRQRPREFHQSMRVV